MALFVNQENTRTKLQQRVAADLNEKAKKKAAGEFKDSPDGVDDSQYLKNTKQTTGLAWVWALLAIISIGLLIWLVVISR